MRERRLAAGVERLVDHRVDRALDERTQVGAAEEGRPLREPPRSTLLGRAVRAGQLEDPLARLLVGRRHEQQPVEAAGALDRLVDVPGRVRRREDEDALVVGADRVELLEQLVDERPPRAPGVLAAREADRVELVEEEHARRRARACSNTSCRFRSLTPMNGSRISSMRTFENGSPHSPAVARASIVLPQPGGPKSSTPPPARRP